MKNNFYSIFIATLAVFFVSCSNSNNTTTAQTNTTTTTATTEQPAVPVPSYPSVPKSVVDKILNECTLIDYIFYELPISMSQDDKASIVQAANHIDINGAAAKIDPKVKSAAHLVYQADGEIFLEGELYFGPNNNYYFIFSDKNRKPLYANAMSASGVNFFQKVFAQVGVKTK
ncbi:MAG: hypothetical protein KA974_04915 [Saprospiraceae bacterium]|nr:hypothetical protein [Saprospiraceae bacterium]MBP7699128.1 hypothetical protein [Saprospiraceae bacterium]